MSLIKKNNKLILDEISPICPFLSYLSIEEGYRKCVEKYCMFWFADQEACSMWVIASSMVEIASCLVEESNPNE